MGGATFEFGYSGRSVIMRVTRSQILTSVVMDDPGKAVKVRHPVKTCCRTGTFISASPLGPPPGPKLQGLRAGIILALRAILGIFVEVLSRTMSHLEYRSLSLLPPRSTVSSIVSRRRVTDHYGRIVRRLPTAEN
jgi:hypothetical protein